MHFVLVGTKKPYRVRYGVKAVLPWAEPKRLTSFRVR